MIKCIKILLLSILCFQGSAQSVLMNILENGTSFRIKATKLNDEFRIVYMRKDTSDRQKINEEMNKMGISLGLVAQNFGPLGPEKARQKAKEFYSMVDRYTYFIKDSTQFKADSEPDFTRSFNLLLTTPESVLNKDHRPQNTMVLDGISFFWDISNKNILKQIGANTPSETTHPLLYPYVKSIFTIYRKRINGDLFGDFYYYRKN